MTEIVESTIQGIGQIATLPAVAARIVRLCEDPETTIEDFNQVVINDPVLGVRILKLVNSAYYGMPDQISTIKHAIVLLGPQAVKNIAIAASLAKLIRGRLVGSSFNANDLWIHSIAVATGAQMLAHQSHGIHCDEAFLAGLIHDIGIVVELQAFSNTFAQMISSIDADETLTFRMAEKTAMGASHEMFGAGLCQAWNLPASLKLATGYHHHPWDLAEEHRLLPAIVHIADVLAANAGLGYSRTVETRSVDSAVLDGVHLTEADLEMVFDGLPAAMELSLGLLSDGS